ncbi:hypothetical protein [Cellulomonas sp. ICMP 17802]|uniref:hypothetical protein n=1 Tax=Cellulomonas sp. ICMP 17802 TaxID=3239199 RepID=UPI00351B97C3
MITRLRSGSALSIALGAVLALACVVCGAAGAGAAALPRTAGMTFTFENLFPDRTVTQSRVLDVPTDSSITTVRLREGGPAGGVAWVASLCPASGSCVPLIDGGTGILVPTGRYALTVSATARTLVPGETASLEGHVVLVETGGRLASTGADLVWPLLAAAVALLGGGMFLVALSRRRDRQDPTPDRGAASC